MMSFTGKFIAYIPFFWYIFSNLRHGNPLYLKSFSVMRFKTAETPYFFNKSMSFSEFG
jgi:hypothetical protein